MKKIYSRTRTGGKGMTQLANGTNISKDSDHISAVGSIDELNSFLGLVKAHISSKTAGGSLIERISRIQQEVTELNKQLGTTEQIKRFRLVCEQWSPETGELSHKLSLRRKVIYTKYDNILKEIYSATKESELAN